MKKKSKSSIMRKKSNNFQQLFSGPEKTNISGPRKDLSKIITDFMLPYHLFSMFKGKYFAF